MIADRSMGSTWMCPGAASAAAATRSAHRLLAARAVLPVTGHALQQPSLPSVQQWVTTQEPGGDRQLKQTVGSLQSMLASEVQLRGPLAQVPT